MTCSQLASLLLHYRGIQGLWSFIFCVIGSICHCCRQCSRYFLREYFRICRDFLSPHLPGRNLDHLHRLEVQASASSLVTSFLPRSLFFSWHPPTCALFALYTSLLHTIDHLLSVITNVSLIQNAVKKKHPVSHGVTLSSEQPRPEPLEVWCWISGFRKLVVLPQVTLTFRFCSFSHCI